MKRIPTPKAKSWKVVIFFPFKNLSIPSNFWRITLTKQEREQPHQKKKWHSHLSRQKFKISFRKCVYRCLRIRERARHPVRQHFIGINFEGALLPGQHHRGHKKEHLTGVDRSWALPPGCDAELFYMHLDLSPFFVGLGSSLAAGKAIL